MATTTSGVPLIVSADDHVVEPPDLWEGRVPARWADRAPRVERRRLQFVGGSRGREWVEDPDSPWCDAWHYDGTVIPLSRLLAAVGLEQDEVDVKVTTYDDIHLGAWDQAQRLADMDANHIEAALQFPNVFRFAGQTFSEQADKDLALACIRAYNDWLIDTWGGGAGRGRLLPVTILPLWDGELARDELLRCADKGSFLVTFPENPVPLGFPSFYTEHWDPFLRACEDTGTVVNMHIGSSSRTAHATPEAPYIVTSTQTFVNTQGSLLDLIFSGTLQRHPRLTVSYAESQIGWLPYVLERADKLWAERADNDFGSWLPIPPSQYLPGRVFFCMYDDEVGLRNRDLIGMDQITFETDYPHADTTFPNTEQVFTELCDDAGLSPAERVALARGNLVHGYGLDRYGLA
jgi:predicted TIM-barrel fold metal-dependent hydrolase